MTDEQKQAVDQHDRFLDDLEADYNEAYGDSKLNAALFGKLREVYRREVEEGAV